MGAEVNEYAWTRIDALAVVRAFTTASVHPPVGEK